MLNFISSMTTRPFRGFVILANQATTHFRIAVMLNQTAQENLRCRYEPTCLPIKRSAIQSVEDVRVELMSRSDQLFNFNWKWVLAIRHHVRDRMVTGFSICH